MITPSRILNLVLYRALIFLKFHFKLNVMNRSFLFLLINHLYNKTQEQQQFTHNNPVSTVYTLDILSKLNTVTTYMYI